MYQVGDAVEVDGHREPGCTGGWFPATVLATGGTTKLEIQFDFALEKGEPMRDTVKRSLIRPKPPLPAYETFNDICVGMVVDHLVEDLWWLAIVLWVKRDDLGVVNEVGCVYPKTAGEEPQVATTPSALRPAFEWSAKTQNWCSIFNVYKIKLFQNELNVQATKRNVPKADVTCVPAEFAAKKRQISDPITRTPLSKRSKSAGSEVTNARVTAAAVKPDPAVAEAQAKRNPHASNGAPANFSSQPQIKIDRNAACVDSGGAKVETLVKTEAPDDKKAGTARAPDAENHSRGDSETNQPELTTLYGDSKPAPRTTSANKDNKSKAPSYQNFRLCGNPPAYSIFHDERAYYVVMVLPGVEPQNCWTQVTAEGILEVAWSMTGPEGHWAEMNSLRLPEKEELTNYISDLLQPQQEVWRVGRDNAILPPQHTELTHRTQIQLPVRRHGDVHTTVPPPGTGKVPRASLRLGMYKAKIYKLCVEHDGQ